MSTIKYSATQTMGKGGGWQKKSTIFIKELTRKKSFKKHTHTVLNVLCDYLPLADEEREAHDKDAKHFFLMFIYLF